MARSTNGTSDIISFGNLSSILSTGDGSMAIWARMATASSANYRSIFSSGTNRGGGGNDNFNFECNSNADPSPNFFQVQISNAGTGSAVVLAAADTNWHSLGMSYKSVGTIVTGYLDGVNKGTSNILARTNPSIATTIGVGHAPAGTNAEFCNLSGAADAAIWNIVLTDAEFAALAKGARPYQIRPTGLIFWAPLDGLQSPEPDLSGGAHNGTLTGTALASGPPVMPFTPRSPQFSAAPLKPFPPFQLRAA